MKHLKITILTVMILIVYQAQAQIVWPKVDFSKDYKVDTKIQGGVAKSLKNNPTFINDYSLIQASHMKGSSQAGTLQKQGVGTVFAEAALAGVSSEALQSLVEELYSNFVTELQNIGLTITDGEELMNTKYVQGKKGGKNVLIGKTDGKYIYDKAGAMDVSGSPVKEKYIFRPKGNNVFTTFKIPANFYQNLASKQSVNLISIGYDIRFANFEGKKKGLSKNSLTTSAGLVIIPRVTLINPKGSFSWIVYKNNIEGNNDWSKGLIQKKSRDGSAFGLSSSADYAIEADQKKYLSEVKAIVINLQKDIAENIKESF